MNSRFLLLVLALASPGCTGPQPARTTVTPGRQEVTAEREEKRPSKTVIEIDLRPACRPEEKP